MTKFTIQACLVYTIVFLAPLFNWGQTRQLDSLQNLITKRPGDVSLQALYNYFQGQLAYQQSRYDSSIFFLEKALSAAKILKNDTLQLKALNLMGDAWSDKGDNPRALSLYQQAVLLAEKSGQKEMRARVIKNIGVLYVSWQKLDLAKSHYDSAMQIARELGNESLIADCKNNLGIVYELKEEYPQAIQLYNEALRYYESAGKKESIAMALSNLAIAYKYSGDLSRSIEYNKKALELSREMQDKWKEAATLNNIGNAYLIMKDPQKAYDYAKRSAELSRIIGAKEVLHIALQTLSESAYELGNFKEATDHLRQMMVVKDSFINLESSRQVAELQTKYETAQKEKQIQEQKFEIHRKNLQLGLVALAIILSGGLVYGFYKREKLKQEQEKQAILLQQQEEATRAVLKAEESERSRIAAELHDGVGQMMSAARMNLEVLAKDLDFIPLIQKEKMERLISMVDDGCREVRLVSHGMMPNALLKKGLGSAISDFLQKIDQQIIKTSLHVEGIEGRLQVETESVLYRIIQECVNNVIKHSGANQLDISVVRDGEELSISIEDNGKGFDPKQLADGIGMQNIKGRVQILRGKLEIDSAPGRGTFIGIYVPL